MAPPTINKNHSIESTLLNAVEHKGTAARIWPRRDPRKPLVLGALDIGQLLCLVGADPHVPAPPINYDAAGVAGYDAWRRAAGERQRHEGTNKPIHQKSFPSQAFRTRPNTWKSMSGLMTQSRYDLFSERTTKPSPGMRCSRLMKPSLPTLKK